MSGYLRVLKRKAGILGTQPVALATLPGELSPVTLANCDQGPSCLGPELESSSESTRKETPEDHGP